MCNVGLNEPDFPASISERVDHEPANMDISQPANMDIVSRSTAAAALYTKNMHQFYLSKLGMNEYPMIPSNSNILVAPIYLPLNLKFLYKSTLIQYPSFSPHSYHFPPLPSLILLSFPPSHHCPLLPHITALPSLHSHHCPFLPHITALPSVASLSSPPLPHSPPF